MLLGGYIKNSPKLTKILVLSLLSTVSHGQETRDFLTENAIPIKIFKKEKKKFPLQKYWIALVPGSSEQWGHHKAPPAQLEKQNIFISDDFKNRLNQAAILLQNGIVRFILVSGGAVDSERPDYVEAYRGADYLRSVIKDTSLHSRILIDSFAFTSVTNIRNAEKLCVDLGLDHYLIVSRAFFQSSYFLFHHFGFDRRSKKMIGYTLGEFTRIQLLQIQMNDSVEIIENSNFNIERLKLDQYGS